MFARSFFCIGFLLLFFFLDIAEVTFSPFFLFSYRSILHIGVGHLSH